MPQEIDTSKHDGLAERSVVTAVRESLTQNMTTEGERTGNVSRIETMEFD